MALGEGFMSSKRYREEFKIEAVEQVVEQGHSVVSVASRLGMTTQISLRYRPPAPPAIVPVWPQAPTLAQ